MNSRADLAPSIHPAMVATPVVAFCIAFAADLFFLQDGFYPWTQVAFAALALGVIATLAVTGLLLIDFSDFEPGSRARGTASLHLTLNAAVVALYLVSLYIRWAASPLPLIPDSTAFAAAFFAFGLVAVSGWLGGRLVVELRPRPGQTQGMAHGQA